MLKARDEGDELRNEKFGCCRAPASAIAVSSLRGLLEVNVCNFSMMASLRAASASRLDVTVCDAAALCRSSCTDSGVGALGAGGNERFYQPQISGCHLIATIAGSSNRSVIFTKSRHFKRAAYLIVAQPNPSCKIFRN